MRDGEDGGSPREQELQRQLDAAQANSHIGIWELDVATGRVTWSDELYRIFGFAPGTPISLETTLRIVQPADRAHVVRQIQVMLHRKGRFSYRTQVTRTDGSVRTIDVIGDPVVDARGHVVKLEGTCRDVTDLVYRDVQLRFYVDVFAHVQIALSAWQLDGDPATLRLVAYNPATEAMVGSSLAGREGQPITAIVPALGDPAVLELARGLGEAQPVRRLAARSLDAASPGAPIVVASLFALPNHHVGLALEDVTVQARTQCVQECERRALEMLAGGSPLRAILGEVVHGIEEVSVGTLASIMLIDETGSRIREGAAPSIPAGFGRAIDGLPIGPAAGSCGTAMHRGEPVFVADIARDPLWAPYRAHALAHGLRACWSHPILGNDGRVLGSFALYRRTPGMPDDTTKELMQRAAHVVGIVLERRALDEQLRALAGHIEAAREDERTTIARDIHDQLGQALTALKLDIGWLQRRIDAAPLGDKLDDMGRAVDDLLRSVRRIAADLRPGLVDDLGLRAALEWHAEQFTQRTGTPCQIAGELDVPVERIVATNVFRIFQEALTNIARHANATRVDVTLAVEHGELRLDIADDGIGLPEVRPRGTHLGIVGMRERALRLGGACTVRRRSPRGTVVSVVVPLRVPTERATASP